MDLFTKCNWITWVFSGIGVSVVSVLSCIIKKLFIKPKDHAKQIQKSGRCSNNYQSGGDINIGNNNYDK